jgi:hypothetical protein
MYFMLLQFRNLVKPDYKNIGSLDLDASSQDANSEISSALPQFRHLMSLTTKTMETKNWNKTT